MGLYSFFCINCKVSSFVSVSELFREWRTVPGFRPASRDYLFFFLKNFVQKHVLQLTSSVSASKKMYFIDFKTVLFWYQQSRCFVLTIVKILLLITFWLFLGKKNALRRHYISQVLFKILAALLTQNQFY